MAINDPNVYEGHYDKFDCSSPCCFNCKKSNEIDLLSGGHFLICEDRSVEVTMDSVCDDFKCSIDRRKVESFNKFLRQFYGEE